MTDCGSKDDSEDEISLRNKGMNITHGMQVGILTLYVMKTSIRKKERNTCAA